jgi:endonuclease-3
MTKKERYRFIIDWFSQHMPDAETELQYQNPFELLVAVILSAQCTDKRVNMVTPFIFKKYPSATALAEATIEDLTEIIKSISFANNKAKHLLGMAKMLVAEYNSVVPDDVDELQRLPGVGRKTANVITSVIYNQPNMAVDTHVFRVAARIGLTTNAKNPLQTELQLIKEIPKELIHKAHHWLILHGRYTCIARKPKCESCGIKAACKFFEKEIEQ